MWKRRTFVIFRTLVGLGMMVIGFAGLTILPTSSFGSHMGPLGRLVVIGVGMLLAFGGALVATGAYGKKK